jgi:hypothetical protein
MWLLKMKRRVHRMLGGNSATAGFTSRGVVLYCTVLLI